MAKKKPEVFNLGNGMQVLYQRLAYSRMVHCGFFLNVGSRHEEPEKNGVAHLVEHGVFKGTKQRKPFDILTRMENVGGELDAYTSRDKTGYTAAAPSRYAERALELMTDMLFQPTFPEGEINKEKQVVREELEMYEDTPEESIMDDFHALHYYGQPLGYNIIGTRDSLHRLKAKDLANFHKAHYKPENMVVGIVGNVTPRRVQQLIGKYLEPLPSKADTGRADRNQTGNALSYPFRKSLQKDFQQTYCMLGIPAYSRTDKHRHTMQVLNALLGGTDMSARLNLRLREQKGYVYQIDTAYMAYADTGIFTIDFTTDQQYYERCINLVHQELRKIRDQVPGKIQINRAKRQLLGQASMVEEQPPSLMQTLAVNLLDQGKIYSYDDYAASIQSVTSVKVTEVAQNLFDPERISFLSYQPKPE